MRFLLALLILVSASPARDIEWHVDMADARKAARSLVAAYLNASQDKVNSSFSAMRLTNAGDAAVAGNIAFIDLHTNLDELNNLGCQLD